MDVSRVRQFDEKQWKSIDQFEESQIIQIFPRFLRLPPVTRCTVNLFPALPSDYFYLHAFSRAWLWRRAPRYSYSVAFQWLWRSSQFRSFFALTATFPCKFLRLQTNSYPTKKTKVTVKISYCPSCSNMVEHFMMSFLWTGPMLTPEYCWIKENGIETILIQHGFSCSIK